MNEVFPGLRERRKAAGLTLREMAAELGCSPPAVNCWELGETLPTADRLPEIARVLGCTVDELYKNYTEFEEARP